MDTTRDQEAPTAADPAAEQWTKEAWAALTAFEQARNARRRLPYVITEAAFEMYHSHRSDDTDEKVIAAAVAEMQLGMDYEVEQGLTPGRAAAATCDQAVWHAGRLIAAIQAGPDGKARAVRLRRED